MSGDDMLDEAEKEANRRRVGVKAYEFLEAISSPNPQPPAIRQLAQEFLDAQATANVEGMERTVQLANAVLQRNQGS